MNTSSVPRLEPMTFGGVLDKTLRLYFNNLAQVVAIVAVVFLPFYGVRLALSLMYAQPAELGNPGSPLAAMASSGSVISMLTTAVWFVFGMPLATGAITYAVSERFMGNAISVAAAYRMALRRFGALFGSNLLLSLATFGPYFLFLFGGVFVMMTGVSHGHVDTGLMVVGIGVIALGLAWIPVMIYLLGGLRMCVPAVMVEQLSAVASIRRSWRLSAGSRWWVVGLLIVIGLIGMVPGIAVGMVVGMMAVFQADPTVQVIVATTAESAVSMLVEPLGMIVVVLAYYNLRMRKEAFDLTVLGNSLGLTLNPAVGATAQPWPAQQGPAQQWPAQQWPGQQWPAVQPGQPGQPPQQPVQQPSPALWPEQLQWQPPPAGPQPPPTWGAQPPPTSGGQQPPTGQHQPPPTSGQGPLI